MFIGSTLCVLMLMTLLTVNSRELFEVAPTDFAVDIVATQHVLGALCQRSLPCSELFRTLIEF